MGKALFLCTALLLLVAGRAGAAPCKLAIQSDSVLRLSDGAVSPHRAGTHPIIRDCEDTTLVTGAACILEQDTLGSVQCIAQTPGQLLRPGTAQSGATIVLAMAELTTRTERRSGSPQAANRVGLIGFPIGQVLPPTDMLVIPLALDGGSATAVSITDSASGKVVYARSQEAGHIRVPMALLATGGSYRWSASVGGAPYSGDFTLATAADATALADIVRGKTTAAGASNPVAARLTEMLVLKEYGYLFDAQRIALELQSGRGGSDQ